MTVTVSARLAAALFGSTLLLAGATMPAYADAPTKGEIKIKAPGDTVVVPGIGGKPKVPGCEVVIEIHGYTVDKGKATVDFSAKDGELSWVGNQTIDLHGGHSGETLNGSGDYTITPTGVTVGEDGYLITVKVDGSVTGAETREFWLDCHPTAPTPATQTPSTETTETTVNTNTGDSSSSGPVGDTRAAEGNVQDKGHIKKVNSGGTTDASGLVFLGIAGIGLAGAAGFGLNRKRKRN